MSKTLTASAAKKPERRAATSGGRAGGSMSLAAREASARHDAEAEKTEAKQGAAPIAASKEGK